MLVNHAAQTIKVIICGLQFKNTWTFTASKSTGEGNLLSTNKNIQMAFCPVKSPC